MLQKEQGQLPRAFGDYALLRRIAVGGMAEVYVAKTKGLGGFEKQVAIKVIHPRYSEDDEFVEMLIEEAKISVLLNHVNIAQTFDLGRIEDTHYIAMEFVEGADAYRVMRRAHERGRALPIDLCAYIAAEVCNGLGYAHRKHDSDGRPLHIVHRDISPQNILVSYTGEVKIVDFGIAKAALRSRQTEVGVIKGKYYYMSPEQAWGDPMDHRSDVFSTGVVLYELLTGRMLYAEDNVPRLLDKVRKAEIAPPETRRPSIPRALSEIVMTALNPDAARRFQSAEEMSRALMGFLHAEYPAFRTSRLGDLMSTLFFDETDVQRRTIELPPIESVPSSGVPGDPSSRPRSVTMRLDSDAPDELRAPHTSSASETSRPVTDVSDDDPTEYEADGAELLARYASEQRKLEAASGPRPSEGEGAPTAATTVTEWEDSTRLEEPRFDDLGQVAGASDERGAQAAEKIGLVQPRSAASGAAPVQWDDATTLDEVSAVQEAELSAASEGDPMAAIAASPPARAVSLSQSDHRRARFGWMLVIAACVSFGAIVLAVAIALSRGS